MISLFRSIVAGVAVSVTISTAVAGQDTSLVATHNVRLHELASLHAHSLRTLKKGAKATLVLPDSTDGAFYHVAVGADTGYASWRYMRHAGAADNPTVLATVASTTPTIACPGSFRWAIKTMEDPGADQIASHATSTTIKQLGKLHRPTVDTKIRNTPVEIGRFMVNAILVRWAQEDDKDLHLVLEDPNDHNATLVAEIPNPQCSSVAGSPEADLFAAARKAVVNKLGQPSSSFRDVNLHVRVTGVAFFDKQAHGGGHAPNGIELHPVLKIAFPSP
jgi:hypothetical protein